MSAALAQKKSSPPLEVKRCATVDSREWDGFVEAHSDGSFFHLSGWGRAIKSAYAYEPVYITARRDGELVGVLMMNDVRAPLLGRSLISTAFTVGGGPLADDAEALAALLEEADAAGSERCVRYVECRSAVENEGWTAKAGTYAGFTLTLPEGENEHLAAIPRKRRAEIRKCLSAAQSGALSVRYGADPNEFYRLYAHSLHSLGTPVFPKKYLHALIDEFEDRLEICTVDYLGAPVASLLSFYFRDAVLPYYVGATNQAKSARAYDYLYWSMMRRAAARGCRIFDFGRSKIDTGPYVYKKTWGAPPAPLCYSVKLMGATQMPNVNPTNPKFALFAKIWPRLPLAVANRLGPVLAPNFP